MRRVRVALTVAVEDERGAISVIVALVMVVLLGFGALAVDVGMIYAEKAQLQNGADAAAIATAQKCAVDAGGAGCTNALSRARSLANGNAVDDKSNIRNFEVNTSAREVSVIAGALEDGQAPNRVSLIFARALGFQSAEVAATSKAQWGGPSKVKAPFAITFSKCEIDSTRTADGSLQFLVSHGINDKGDNCHGTSSGQEIPGGFGWLVQDTTGSCEATVSLSSPWVTSDTGSNLKPGCGPRLDQWRAKLESGEKLVQLFPVFDDTSGNGSNGQFRIVAFAAIAIQGWNFQSHEYMLPDARRHFNDNGYKNSDRGFVGRFVRYVSLDAAVELGGPMTYGASTAQLTQ